MLRNLGLLTLAVFVTLIVAGWIACSRHGIAGLEAVLVAAGTCWISSVAALYLTEKLRLAGHIIPGVFAGMLLRLALPLATGIFLSEWGGALADAGVFGFIVVFYLVTLAVETALSVRLIQQQQRTVHPS
jgi:hypothetical protein